MYSLLMKLKDNRPLIYIGQLFSLSLVALAATGCAGQWIIALEPNSLPCIKGAYKCYQGQPLSLPEFVFILGASKSLLLLPIIYIFTAILLSFKPPLTYSIFMLLGIAAFGVSASDSQPYMYYISGTGKRLHTLATVFIMLISIPLSLNELIGHEGTFRHF